MAAVFLVEDEPLIRMMIADMLGDLGHTVAGEANDLASGLALAQSLAADFAVLDLQLGLDNSAPIAEVLQNRSIPFAFASGYGADGMPSAFSDKPILRKPFTIDELAQCLAIFST